MFHNVWLEQLQMLTRHGIQVGPRGEETVEVLDAKFVLSGARRNLLDVRERHLSYRYAVAEWLWIMFGHSDLASIERYNPNLRQFSDDGIWLAGAYGPHVYPGLRKVVKLLTADKFTRQAVIEIGRPHNPTKDEPCTLSMQFLNRGERLHGIVTMRSSDVWLGLPYDIYTFTQIQNCLAGAMGWPVGALTLNAGSSHLYKSDEPSALRVLTDCWSYQEPTTILSPALPGFPPQWLDDVFLSADISRMPMDAADPWRTYAFALCSPAQAEVRRLLMSLSGVVPEVA